MKHYHNLAFKHNKDGTVDIVKDWQCFFDQPHDTPMIIPEGFEPFWVPFWTVCNNALSWLDDSRNWQGDPYNSDAMCLIAGPLNNLIQR